MDKKTGEAAFIYGTQYYRAPTPGPECWAEDFANIKRMGFNEVKFFLQWRWSERREGEYVWDDLDRLMDLAKDHGLGVTLNFIYDVTPGWVYRKYPDCIVIDSRGLRVEPTANICRQIGGYPGPCYSHGAACEARKRFMEAAVLHFRGHPAMHMWDVWNEPEHNLMRRDATFENLMCYCPHCEEKFKAAMKKKYNTIEALNTIWGRCYVDFDEIELPRAAATVMDFIDWREFQIDILSEEAAWRFEIVKRLDPAHECYLHVVADSVNCFNAVTGVDDFVLARMGDVFGSTMTGDPLLCAQAVSAAQGKKFINAEWHVNFGVTNMHQRVLDRDTFLRELLPQLGWGVRGLLYWQYRAETFGIESPGWGLVRTDGSRRPVTGWAEEFIRLLAPHAKNLMAASSEPARIGIWRSRRNELFHYCMDDNLKRLRTSLEQYVDTLYRLNLPFRIVGGDQLRRGELSELRFLILPTAYFMDQEEAESLDRFLQTGGVVLVEGHPAGYNGTHGRHSQRIPGCGLAERWGLYECESTSSFHLPPTEHHAGGGGPEASGDIRKALLGSGASGGEYFPLTAPDGTHGYGALRFAELAGSALTPEAFFQDRLVVASKALGKGQLYYAGTLLSSGAVRGSALFEQILLAAAKKAGIHPTPSAPGCRTDVLLNDGRPAFVTALNRGHDMQELPLPEGQGVWHGIFHGSKTKPGGKAKLAAGTAELFVMENS